MKEKEYRGRSLSRRRRGGDIITGNPKKTCNRKGDCPDSRDPARRGCKKLLAICFCGVSVLIICSSAQAHKVLPLSDALSSEAYDFIDRMISKQYLTGIVKNTRPYSRDEVGYILIQLNQQLKQNQVKLSAIEQSRLKRLLDFLYFENFYKDAKSPSTQNLLFKNSTLEASGKGYRFIMGLEAGEEIVSREKVKNSGTAYITMLRPIVYGEVKDNFAFYTDLIFYYLSGEQFADVPKTEARESQTGLNSSTAAFTVAFAQFNLPWFELLLGKGNLYWGPGRHGALLVSDNPLPFNMIQLTAHYPSARFPRRKGPNVKFHAFTGILGSSLSRKYLSGHRLEIGLWDRVNLGIAETIAYADRFEAVYLNPLQIYLVSELPVKYIRGEGRESPDNVLISGDFDLLLRKNLSVYGELMIDDFQPNYGLRSYRHQGSRFGWLLGLYYVNPFSLPDSEFRLEYAFINQYAYTHYTPANYTNYDRVIGHRIGSDADDVWLHFRRWLTSTFLVSVSFEIERHGEGNANKTHPSYAPYDEEWEFLSGITESTSSVSLSLSYTSIGRYLAEFAYTLSRAKNVDNQLNRNATEHQLVLRGQYRF